MRVAARAMATEAASARIIIGSNSSGWDGQKPLLLWSASLLGLMTTSSLIEMEAKKKEPKKNEIGQLMPDNYPPMRKDLPTFTLEEIAEHADEGESVGLYSSFRRLLFLLRLADLTL